MPRILSLLALLGLFASPSAALASYQMFCEMDGEVVSTPTFSEFIEFEFQVTDSRDIEVEILGGGEPDCQLMTGKTITVVLEPKDAGDKTQISNGAQLTLERFEMDVILEKTGDVVRSIKHVRTGM